ncbi:uncharacterized protein LOC112500016 [Cynara cardunculus var. scolymus]|uniref:uncharacterized protein LOC112500016 n=1 Tax=Cynara cardunculus var. scolymus TaxID=59895 RepID=UPI000D62C743|nr:uncharacterized protein LOC112500016 [Cynara cardunculus var. scolymus]
MTNLSGFLELLKGPLKILSRNGKLMAFTAILYLIFYSISFLLYTYSSNPFITDFVIKLFNLASERPGTPEYTKLLADIREDIGIFLGIEVAYIILLFFVIVLAQTAIVIIASSYYSGDNLSIKELLRKVSITWTRPFVTLFYVQLLALGYMSLFFWPLFVPSLVLFDHPIILIILLVILGILIFTFYLYLSVVWALAVVVSVVEDSYGLSALGKARELVKGNRGDGFLLNLFLVLVSLVFVPFQMKLSSSMPIVFVVSQSVFTCVVSIFQVMAYSVFYFQCKNHMKKSEGFEYHQIPIAAVLDENIP